MNFMNLFIRISLLLLLISLPILSESNNILDKKSILKLRKQVAKEQRDKNKKKFKDYKKNLSDSSGSGYEVIPERIKHLETLTFNEVKILKTFAEYAVVSYPSTGNHGLELIIEAPAIYFKVGKNWYQKKFLNISATEINLVFINNDKIPDFIGLENCCGILYIELLLSKNNHNYENYFFKFRETRFKLVKGKCSNFKIDGIEFNNKIERTKITFNCASNILIRNDISNYKKKKN